MAKGKENQEKEAEKQPSGATVKVPEILKSAYTVAVAALVIGLLIGFGGAAFIIPVELSGPEDTCESTHTLSGEEAVSKTISYINANLMQDGFSANGGSVTPIGDSLYEVNFKVSDGEEEQDASVFVSADGKKMFIATPNYNVFDLDTPLPEPEQPAPVSKPEVEANSPENEEIKTFMDSGLDICYADEKPVIRMYGASYCGYCQWSKPVFQEVVEEYVAEGKIVAYLWEDGKNVLSEEQEAMSAEESALRDKFGFSGVPAFVFGCKYYRSGAPYSVSDDVEGEKTELRAVIDDLLAASQ